MKNSGPSNTETSKTHRQHHLESELKSSKKRYQIKNAPLIIIFIIKSIIIPILPFFFNLDSHTNLPLRLNIKKKKKLQKLFEASSNFQRL